MSETKRTAKESLLAALSEGRCTPRQLQEKTGVSGGAVRKALIELRRAGEVSKLEDGRYMRGKPPAPKPEEDPNVDRILKMLEGGALDAGTIARALGIEVKACSNLLQRMRSAGDVEVAGIKRGTRWHLPGHKPRRGVALETPLKKVRFDKLDKEDPVVAALLEQRAAADDRHTREIARIDRMLSIASEA